MKLIGDPQNKIKVIHVAGTSGKTSTSYFIASLLAQADLKVGLTVSPHIDKVSERQQINCQPVSDQTFVEQLGEFIDIVHETKIDLTYFEVLMALAYWYFAKVGVDVAVIETGLGGLLDSSNVVSSKDKFCVITDIGFDHTEILGETLPEIAAQKAGIIQPGNTVFMYDQGSVVGSVFGKRCDKQQATLNIVRPDFDSAFSHLPLFQQRNFNLAHQVANQWLSHNSLPQLQPSQIKKASLVKVPGRMEIHRLDNKTLILDGAHNAQKMQNFVNSFKARFPGQKAAILLAIKQGKDYQHVLDMLLPIADHLILTNFDASQDIPVKSMRPEQLAAACDEKGFANYEIIENLALAYQKLGQSQSNLLVATGSLYLVANLRAIAKL